MAILEATVSALLELGFARTTTLEVQKRAGISRGALLHHFPSKAELLAACVAHLAKLRGVELYELASELPEGDGRADAALDLLWQSFSGPLFCVALELRNAARTDDEFRAVLKEAELDLRDRIMRQSRSLFGAEVASRPGFECALDITLQLMIGAAASASLHDDQDKTKVLMARWKTIFPTLLAD